MYTRIFVALHTVPPSKRLAHARGYLQPMHTKGGLLGGWWASVVTDTHVDLPQIFLWYHCLQLVKYFLLVPMSFCTAHTLGLKTKAAVLAKRLASHLPPHPSHHVGPPGSPEGSRYGEDTVISVSLGVHSGPRDPDFHHPSQKYPPKFKNCQSIYHTVTSFHLNILL